MSFCPIRTVLRRVLPHNAIAVGLLLTSQVAFAQLVRGSLDVQWDGGAATCGAGFYPLQVHLYDARTFIIRESLCATSEAPFLYLLLGSRRSLLIDTGDVGDPARMPLAKSVFGLMAEYDSSNSSLLIVHTHRHLDHRSGDIQFQHLPNVQIVGFELASVQRYYGFAEWPAGSAQIDLGDRIIDVIPTPGHSETEVCFYDRQTGLLFSGDFLMPARLLVDNLADYIASANRLAGFTRNHPVTFILGGHIEEDSAGRLYAWGSQYHPHEHVLQMTRADLLALPAALATFNGFYSVRGHFTIENSTRILIVGGALVLIFLALVVWTAVQLWRRRKGAPIRDASAAVAADE